MTDATDRAIAAIVRTFKQAAAERADLDRAARQVLAALTGLGWRPTSAAAAPDWQHRDMPPVPPTAEYLAARAAHALAAHLGPDERGFGEPTPPEQP